MVLISCSPADPVEEHKNGRRAVFSALDAVPQLDDKVRAAAMLPLSSNQD
jgi:hypothetical protein